MTHITATPITQPTENDLVHLEVCDRCRRLIATDVDVASVRARVLTDVGSMSTAGSRFRIRRPWVAAAAAAAVATVAIVPISWLGWLRDGPGANAPAETSGTSSATPESTTVVPGDSHGLSFALLGDHESFELSFTVGSAGVGRLIWAAPTSYEGLRGDASAFTYGFYEDGTEVGISDRFDQYADEDGRRPDGTVAEVFSDPEIPWTLLVERADASGLWTWLTGGGIEPESGVTTHPDAAIALTGAGYRLEVSERGVPVLWSGPDVSTFEATSLLHRDIGTRELGNNTDLPFDYAVYLSLTTSDEQRDVLADGVVTLADYLAATADAAACAGGVPVFDGGSRMAEVQDPTGDVATCIDTHVDDIEAVWRTDSQWLDGDEFVAIWYEIRDNQDLVDLHRADTGTFETLAVGTGWTMDIAPRGDGYCMRYTVDTGGGEGCNLVANWLLPGVVDVGLGWHYADDGTVATIEIIGTVTQDALRVIVEFADGTRTETELGDEAVMGIQGFGLLTGADHGDPVAIDVATLDESFTVDLEPLQGPHTGVREARDAAQP